MHLDSLKTDAIPMFPPNIHGKINLHTQFNANGFQDIQVYSDISSPGIAYSFNESLEGIFPISTSARMFLSTDPKFECVVLDSGICTVNDLLSMRMAGDYNVSGKNFDLTVDRGEIENASLIQYLPPQLIKQAGEIKFTGKEQFSMDARGYPVDDSLALAVHAKLCFMDVGFEYPAEQIGIRDFQGVIEVAGNSNRLHGGVDFDLDTLSFMLLRSEPFTGVKLELGWNLQNQDSLWIENGELSIRTMGLQSDFSLHLGQLKTVPDIDAFLTVAFQSEDTIEMIQGVSLSGGWSIQTSVETIDPVLQHYRTGGYLSMDSLCAGQEGGLQVIHANGKMPFQMEVDLKHMSVLPDEKYRVRDWFDYDNQRDIYLSLLSTLGSITVEEIAVSGYHIRNGVFDIEAQSGRIQIPWFYMHILDGNFGGALLIDLGEGKSGDIAYTVRANASRINSAALANFQSEDTEETELDASFAFQGKGVDIDQGIDLEGYFHLTKIGPKFAGTLLESMDPQGTDRSIQLTRKLLGAGWKPKLFSFELRHGYVYPLLSLSQPWFSPIRIPGTLQYGRLPLEFFIKQQLTKAE
jgi:hypothetical protein